MNQHELQGAADIRLVAVIYSGLLCQVMTALEVIARSAIPQSVRCQMLVIIGLEHLLSCSACSTPEFPTTPKMYFVKLTVGHVMQLKAECNFRRVFTLAKDRDLDLDFHVDENGNERAKGLLYIAGKTIQHGYQGRVVCGHCWYAYFLKPQD